MARFELNYHPLWNLFLITTGSVLFAVGLKSFAMPHGLIHGGLYGAALIINYVADVMPTGTLFFVLNTPLLVFGWFRVSRRFFWYTLAATVISSAAMDLVDIPVHVESELYAAIACGVVCGAGAGVVLRSLGSGGGLDIVAIHLYQKYNLGIGRFYLYFNSALFFVGAFMLDTDLVIASLIVVFITSVVMDNVLSMFSQRKMVLVVSDHAEAIGKRIINEMRHGLTFLSGQGAYSGKDKRIILTIVNNMRLKDLEEIVFTTDDHALFIVENTFTVLGSTFARRKMY